MPVRPAVSLLAALLVTTLGLTACTSDRAPAGSPASTTAGTGSAGPASESAAPIPTAVPSPSASRRPAATAGGACVRLTFEGVRRALGTEFGVAAASGTAASSQTCVLQRVGASAPDLTLTVTPARGVTPATFRESYVPARGTARTGVGRAAYSAVIRSASAQPRVELGWLSASGRVYALVYTVGPDEAASVTDRMVGRLASLARSVDATR